VHLLLKTIDEIDETIASMEHESERHRKTVETYTQHETKTSVEVAKHDREFKHKIDTELAELESDLNTFFKERKEHEEGMNQGASIAHVVEELEDIIETLFEHSNLENRSLMQDMLKSVRSKHAI
jgi:predicted  nucleic acid-binding Zn-ribbon protein